MALDVTLDYRRPETLVSSPTRSYQGDCAECDVLVAWSHKAGPGLYHILSTSRRDHFHQVRLDLTSGNERHACSCEWGYYSGVKGVPSSCVHVRMALLKEGSGQAWSWRSRQGEEEMELFSGDEYGVLDAGDGVVFGDNCCFCAGALIPLVGCECVCHLADFSKVESPVSADAIANWCYNCGVRLYGPGQVVYPLNGGAMTVCNACEITLQYPTHLQPEPKRWATARSMAVQECSPSYYIVGNRDTVIVRRDFLGWKCACSRDRMTEATYCEHIQNVLGFRGE